MIVLEDMVTFTPSQLGDMRSQASG
ncbi:hypothetical protein NPIL_367751, partial [Nephila pilipes]